MPCNDDATIKRVYRYYDLVYDGATRRLKSFSLNEKKVERVRRESGFFANTRHGVDFGAMAAQSHYKLRDEHEKYFAMMKGIMGADRQRNWPELGKERRLLILFVAQIIGCYMAHVRKAKLDREFHSLQSVLARISLWSRKRINSTKSPKTQNIETIRGGPTYIMPLSLTSKVL